ncbi:hypothetical protein EMPG_14100 [Blastomyces silverae]|uniref:Uncharacterized protein n=1 Tax=Blastomyces silverae TaxID=2060906 RepID=A0A0H1BHK7_9EURO|nr:hypothetical protein EMPG_14100 [Blastomyces silverae]
MHDGFDLAPYHATKHRDWLLRSFYGASQQKSASSGAWISAAVGHVVNIPPRYPMGIRLGLLAFEEETAREDELTGTGDSRRGRRGSWLNLADGESKWPPQRVSETWYSSPPSPIHKVSSTQRGEPQAQARHVEEKGQPPRH